MEISKKELFILKICVSLIFLVSMIACQSRLFSYRGRTIEPDRRMNLMVDGSYEGIWETFDLTINYRYEKKAETLQLSGDAELSDHYKFNYAALRNFFLTLFFLDDKGKVQESELLLNASFSNIDDRFTFNKSLEIPRGTSSIAFYYDIGVIEELTD